MADTTSPTSSPRLWARIDRVWLAAALIVAIVAIVDFPRTDDVVMFAAKALLGTLPFIAFAVFAIAYLKATGAENLLARAFEGNPARMIIMAALLGGLSPFCSCEVIPFIAALLAVGAPLGAVMAFWLASPLMDPAMFAITTGAITLDFAIAKTFAAVALGLFGGFGTLLLSRTPIFTDPLREKPAVGGCCGVKAPFSATPVWTFWKVPERVQIFRHAGLDNGIFLLKWLTLAYTIEALMVFYMPADFIANVLGGGGLGTILLGSLVGMPAYLNGYAAAPLIGDLLDQGMAPGAAMSFMIAGGVSSIPAALAVWALVKPRVFGAYLSFALAGSVLAGIAWQVIS
ncbi:permease [uncultured Tateyamaria sp.]|uniref:permease n=1 Tax=uncultured Tateyamaria sp. TaxID=455651 RepID=UPI00262F3A19|nr:permease [uncultured Tateyamaria sp.]